MKRKDKKLIRNLAREHYDNGKSMQETFDLVSVKVKHPLNKIADVLRFYPSPILYEEHKKKIFLLFYSIMATEMLILVAAIIASIYGKGVYNIGEDLIFSGYGVFFHKGYSFFLAVFVDTLGESNTNLFGSILFLIIFIVLTTLPIVVWLLAISHIIIGYVNKNLEYIKIIIPYYWYTLIIYLIAVVLVSYVFRDFLTVFGLLLAILPFFLILRLAIKVRKNVTPKYKKVRVVVPGTTSKKKTRLGIIFKEPSSD